jgi:torulene dioxygenase
VINSYEEGDDLVLDVSIFADNSVIWDFVLHELRDITKYNRDGPEIGTARRYRLRNVSASSPDTIRQAEMVFDVPVSKCIELPTVHPNTYHKRYRYAYGISKASRASIISDRLIKLDMEHPKISSENLSDGAAVWTETDCVPGEPIFVPDPNGKEEDDGVLISVVLDGKLGKSMLVVLDAKNMVEVGRAVMDHPFPFGFHGAFVRTIQ